MAQDDSCAEQPGVSADNARKEHRHTATPPKRTGKRRRRRRKIDWDAVRQDFLHSGLSQLRIATMHGTTDTTLRRHIRADGWVRIVPVVPGATEPLAPRSLGTPGHGTQNDDKLDAPRRTAAVPAGTRRKRMVARLFAVLDAKIAEHEARMSDTDENRAPLSAAEAERDARSLTALAQLYAKLVELDEPNGTPEDKQDVKDSDDTDRLRRDLASRLARLKPGGH